MLIGLSSYTKKQHIARATLEATCFQTRALIDAMIKDTAGDHAGLEVLKVDGGMTQSDVTMQLQADLLGIQVERPEMKE
jgi:glycerol kinase